MAPTRSRQAVSVVKDDVTQAPHLIRYLLHTYYVLLILLIYRKDHSAAHVAYPTPLPDSSSGDHCAGHMSLFSLPLPLSTSPVLLSQNHPYVQSGLLCRGVCV